MRYLSIKNLNKYQHYKNRRPPWIKLHVEIFDDYAFQCLQDASKAHLILLWLLASQMDNHVPYDLGFIGRKLGTTSPVDVEELILQGFIEVSQDDGKMLASSKQMNVVETETETEKRQSKKKISAPSSSTSDAASETGNWVTILAADYTDATEGILPIGQLGRALKPLYLKHGLEETRSRWTVFIHHADVKYGCEYFAKHFGEYKPGPKYINGSDDAAVMKVLGMIP